MALLDAAGVPLFTSVTGCAAALEASLAFRMARGRARPPARATLAPPALPPEPGPVPWPAARALLAGAGLELAADIVVHDDAEALRAAPDLPYPVVAKLLGPLHRTDVDGVRLHLAGPEAFLAAARDLLGRGDACLVQPMLAGVEVLVGAVRDPELGAFVLVAPGGVHAELYGERAMAPAPCDAAGAEALLRECRVLDALLAGYRGRPAADRPALLRAVVRASELAAVLGPRLASFDLNPVIVGPPGRGATVVDARVILDP
jgi:acyl-CoA synthetase (NDP forming)